MSAAQQERSPPASRHRGSLGPEVTMSLPSSALITYISDAQKGLVTEGPPHTPSWPRRHLSVGHLGIIGNGHSED